MTDINIYPNIKKIITIVKARYNVFNYIPNTSTDISVQFFDINDCPIETRIYKLTNDNGFKDWGIDDSFLDKWVKQQIQNDTWNK